MKALYDTVSNFYCKRSMQDQEQPTQTLLTSSCIKSTSEQEFTPSEGLSIEVQSDTGYSIHTFISDLQIASYARPTHIRAFFLCLFQVANTRGRARGKNWRQPKSCPHAFPISMTWACFVRLGPLREREREVSLVINTRPEFALEQI